MHDNPIFKDLKGKVIEIKNEKMKHSIIEVVAEPDTLKILDCIFDRSKSLTAIRKKTKMPQTSFYRKVNLLIEMGFIYENGTEKTIDNKTIPKYKCLFKAVGISGFYPLRVFVVVNKLVGDLK